MENIEISPMDGIMLDSQLVVEVTTAVEEVEEIAEEEQVEKDANNFLFFVQGEFRNLFA